MIEIKTQKGQNLLILRRTIFLNIHSNFDQILYNFNPQIKLLIFTHVISDFLKIDVQYNLQTIVFRTIKSIEKKQM